MKCLPLFILLGGVSCAVLADPSHFKESLEIFKVGLRWETPQKKVHAKLSETVRAFEEKLRISLDPDCRWRKLEDGVCVNPYENESNDIETLASTLSKETAGYFNYEAVTKNSDETKRDFDGLSQGYFIERLKDEVRSPWLLDFAGDIYLSGGFTPQGRLTIADPRSDIFMFAEVIMKRGWMIAATARALGATIRGKKKDPDDVANDFARIVLFAAPDFNGARLDAWSTALIAGGLPLLKSLWDLKAYEDQWGYLYFRHAYLDEDESKQVPPTVSPNIQLETNKGKRKLVLPDW